MTDPRDPRELGNILLAAASAARAAYGPDIPLHEVWDVHVQYVPCPDYVEPTVLERYGDPVAQHEAKIAAGEAVRLP